MSNGILFIQKRPHRAGAQTCMARLLAQAEIKALKPVVVISEAGWLSEECERIGVPCLIEPFPSSRALTARMFGNRAWAGRVKKQLEDRSISVGLVHANDHLEGLLGLEASKVLSAKSLMLLRSPGMKESDYHKYRCGEYHRVLCVGEELSEKARKWGAGKEITWVPDGIDPAEFCDIKPVAAAFPSDVLVVGSPLDWKGWGDLADALYVLQEKGVLPELAFHFTGNEPDPARNDLKLERFKGVKFDFMGRQEAFRDLVRKHDLVINPSWHETFGMAAIEVLAAGIPLVSSLSGIMGHIQKDNGFTYPARDVQALADVLENLLQNWSTVDPKLAESQQRIRERFLIEHCVAGMAGAYRELIG